MEFTVFIFMMSWFILTKCKHQSLFIAKLWKPIRAVQTAVIVNYGFFFTKLWNINQVTSQM
jgi:hypothetical protein